MGVWSSKRIHTFPAAFGDDFARELIVRHSREGEALLDPFMGGGTTLLQAQLAGRICSGIDIDPVAYLVAKVATTRYRAATIDRLSEYVYEFLERIGSALHDFGVLERLWAPGSVHEIAGLTLSVPDRPEIEYWFAPAHRALLSGLVAMANDLRPEVARIVRVAISIFNNKKMAEYCQSSDGH